MPKKPTRKNVKKRPAPAKSTKTAPRKRNAVNFLLDDHEKTAVARDIKELTESTGVPMTVGAFAKAAALSYSRLRALKLRLTEMVKASIDSERQHDIDLIELAQMVGLQPRWPDGAPVKSEAELERIQAEREAEVNAHTEDHPDATFGGTGEEVDGGRPG
jgi:hypothetical protein